MKIAITGHTSGIGKALSDLLGKDNEILGLSRSTGYNITILPMRIVEAAKDADVFINNAYDSFGQHDVFTLLLNRWFGDETKTIVNINSRTRYKSSDQRYNMSKRKLFDATLAAINDDNRKCRLINISPGYVSTERLLNAQPHVPIEKMLTPAQLAEMVKWTISQPQNVEVTELSVWVNMAMGGEND